MSSTLHQVVCLAAACTLSAPLGAQPADNIGHERHKLHHNPPHPTDAPTPARFVTSRRSDIVLPLPQEKDAFTFVVYGDRTGGPVDGVKVLADAVRDTNLLEPDLVMTVGDLVNGYNTREPWLEQMREFKGIMGELRCPWFPVPGNHDVYWRGEGRPPRGGEHDEDYEKHFGPLWYAFEHKNSWFIALYSDETNPDTGEKNFENPQNHRMSDEQFNWLKETLQKAKRADHVFLFLHHPRWIGGKNYGSEWERVHELLVSAGNVTAVFAGHIHHMRSDPRDGIEYITAATVGGFNDGVVPDTGWLHEIHVVTVRTQQVAMAAIPVGEVMDVREITGTLIEECARQAAARPAMEPVLPFASDGSARATVLLSLPNTTTRPMDVTLTPSAADPRWTYWPDHAHARIEPGSSASVEFDIRRPAGMADEHFRPAAIDISAQVLLPGHRYTLPDVHALVPTDYSAIPGPAPAPPTAERAMRFRGGDALVVDPSSIPLPDGPFTLECWFKGERFNGRTGLLCKTESSDYGIFVTDGMPTFNVFLGRAYVEAKAKQPVLTPGRWHHIAGVYDGAAGGAGEVRLYLDGRLLSAAKGTGARKVNKLPLVIGADVAAGGKPTSHFTGMIDGVRLSKAALYTGEAFTPARRPTPDASTILLTNMDGMLGLAAWGEGPLRLVGQAAGRPEVVEAK